MVTLSSARIMRAVSLAAMSAASLYAVMVLVAEPTRSLAADNDYLDVDVVIASQISVDCNTLSSRVVRINAGVGINQGDVKSGSGSCVVKTNAPAGYTLKWLVANGTGAAGARTGTGHLNSFINNGTANNAYKVTPFQASMTTASTFTGAAGTTQINWGGRVRASSTTQGGAGVPSFGADTARAYVRVATGTAVSIAKRASQTSVEGDTEILEFRVAYGATAIAPVSTYKARVTVSAVTN